MKRNDRIELLGLGLFTGLMMVMIVSGQSTSAASQAPSLGCSISFSGSLASQAPSLGCSISFSGSLASLQMAPAGRWGIASSSCNVTDQSGGITTGTFTGTFTSDAFNGIVSGTWSVAGSTQTVVASSTDFAVSFSNDQGVGQMALLSSAYQGMLSGTGSQAMLTIGTAGQVSVK